jgi:HSP20 family molecular chaperone IbpA
MTVYRFPVSSVLRAAFPANGLRADVERAMDDVLASRTAAPLPLADAREDAASFTIELDVPGVMPEHVDVLADDGVLTVRGARAPANSLMISGSSWPNALTAASSVVSGC